MPAASSNHNGNKHHSVRVTVLLNSVFFFSHFFLKQSFKVCFVPSFKDKNAKARKDETLAQVDGRPRFQTQVYLTSETELLRP